MTNTTKYIVREVPPEQSDFSLCFDNDGLKEIGGDAGLEADKKEWLFDCFFKSHCGQPDIVEAAHLIFNMLCNAPMSKIIRDRRKQRVPNTYNNGYHMETIYKPERIKKIDY